MLLELSQTKEEKITSSGPKFENTNPVGGSTGPGDGGGIDDGDVTDEKYLIAANGEEITLVNETIL